LLEKSSSSQPTTAPMTIHASSTYISPFANSRLTFRRVDYTCLSSSTICCELTGPDALPRLQTNEWFSSHRLHPYTPVCRASGPHCFASWDTAAPCSGKPWLETIAANATIRDATAFAPPPLSRADDDNSSPRISRRVDSSTIDAENIGERPVLRYDQVAVRSLISQLIQSSSRTANGRPVRPVRLTSASSARRAGGSSLDVSGSVTLEVVPSFCEFAFSDIESGNRPASIPSNQSSYTDSSHARRVLRENLDPFARRPMSRPSRFKSSSRQSDGLNPEVMDKSSSRVYRDLGGIFIASLALIYDTAHAIASLRCEVCSRIELFP